LEQKNYRRENQALRRTLLGIIETFTRLQRPEREAASNDEIQIALNFTCLFPYLFMLCSTTGTNLPSYF